MSFKSGDQFLVTNFEQRLIDLQERFDPFLERYDREHPMVFRDRIAREMYPLFSGLAQRTNIWHPGLGPQAGISEWKAIQISEVGNGADGGYNACTIHDPQTYGFSVESKEYTGLSTEWRSPVTCVRNAMWTEEAKRQVGYIYSMGVMITSQAWEVYSRETYMKFAADASNLFVLSAGLTLEGSPKFTYDPFETYTYSGGPFGADEKVTVLKIDAGVKVSTLNMSFLDLFHMWLDSECPGAAISKEGGLPTFGLMLHMSDFDKMLRDDPDTRADMREAKPEMLFANYTQTFKNLRGWGMIHDSRQMRFRYWKVGADGKLWFRRVLPMREGRSITIGKLPEANPEYLLAEIAVAVVFLNDVYRIRIPPKLDSLSGGTSFGPAPGFSGDWMWINYQSDANPYREVGYHAMRMAAFPKPLRYSTRAMAFAYRRCPQTWASVCKLDAAAGTGAIKLAADAAATDVDATNKTVTVTLASVLGGAIGQSVLVKSGSDFNSTTGVLGFIASDAAAPTYVIGFGDTEWANEANLADSTKWTAAAATVTLQ